MYPAWVQEHRYIDKLYAKGFISSRRTRWYPHLPSVAAACESIAAGNHDVIVLTRKIVCVPECIEARRKYGTVTAVVDGGDFPSIGALREAAAHGFYVFVCEMLPPSWICGEDA
jgi:hypothetical protein